MHTRTTAVYAILASIWMPVLGTRLAAQASTAKGEPHACSLVTSADVEKVTGRPAKKAPGRLSDVQRTSSSCDYYDARVSIALTSRVLMAQRGVAQELEVEGFDTAKHAVSGLGDSAAIYFKPKGRTPQALLLAHAGNRALRVAITMPESETSQAAQPLAVGLAKIALARLD